MPPSRVLLLSLSTGDRRFSHKKGLECGSHCAAFNTCPRSDLRSSSSTLKRDIISWRTAKLTVRKVGRPSKGGGLQKVEPRGSGEPLFFLAKLLQHYLENTPSVLRVKYKPQFRPSKGRQPKALHGRLISKGAPPYPGLRPPELISPRVTRARSAPCPTSGTTPRMTSVKK